MGRQLHKIFLQGLVVVAPLLVTCYVLYWLAVTLESVLGSVVKLALPEKYYLPGMGLVLAVVLSFAIGLLFHVWGVKRLWGWAEGLFDRIPLFKTIYGAVKDLMQFLDQGSSDRTKNVVLVSMPDSSTKLLGFVTREDFSDLPDAMGTEGTIAVYLPMSYQLGGFTVMMPRSKVEPIDMDVQEAMRFVLTGGMTKKR